MKPTRFLDHFSQKGGEILEFLSQLGSDYKVKVGTIVSVWLIIFVTPSIGTRIL